MVPDQDFNTVFLQRYLIGGQVLPHRDPKNNIGYTIISTFGTWREACTHVNEESFILEDSDVAVLPCTINGLQGPRHYMTPVQSGIRYALILNTTI